MKIEYWRKERNIRIGWIQIHRLLLMEIQINVEFEIKKKEGLIKQANNEMI